MINFVLEFAKDLQKLLETLEKEFGKYIVYGRAYYQNKLQERASKLTEELYDKYKKVLDIKILFENTKKNLIIKALDKDVLIPDSFLVSKNFFELKEKYDNIVRRQMLGDSTWVEFSSSLIGIFIYSDSKRISLNINVLEKIRFLMTIFNNFSNFDLEHVPLEFNIQLYKP